METPILSIHSNSDDMKSHNLLLKKYTEALENSKFVLVPSRNKVSVDRRSNIVDVIGISNNRIKKIFQSFKPTGQYIVTSQGYFKQNDPMNNNRMIDEKIEIDGIVYKIRRHLLTFCQPDDTIRTLLHNAVYRLINRYSKQSDGRFCQGILIGGEMYIYGKLLNRFFKSKIYISDTSNIVHDSMLNNPNHVNSSYQLVVYQNILFDWATIRPNSVAICNVSKHGLGNNLCEQIIKIRPKILLIIWCNYRAFKKDYQLLRSFYNLKNIFRYLTNYEVFLGVFESEKFI